MGFHKLLQKQNSYEINVTVYFLLKLLKVVFLR